MTDKIYIGLIKNAQGTWTWYMVEGEIDITYTGLVRNQYIWYYVKESKLDLSYTGMVKNE